MAQEGGGSPGLRVCPRSPEAGPSMTGDLPSAAASSAVAAAAPHRLDEWTGREGQEGRGRLLGGWRRTGSARSACSHAASRVCSRAYGSPRSLVPSLCHGPPSCGAAVLLQLCFRKRGRCRRERVRAVHLDQWIIRVPWPRADLEGSLRLSPSFGSGLCWCFGVRSAPK